MADNSPQTPSEAYGSSNVDESRSGTGKDGNTHHYDGKGNEIGHSETDKGGNTTYYDRDGNKIETKSNEK